MRSLQDIALLCFDYSDIEGLGQATERQIAAACSIITAALQELHTKKPEAFKNRSGATLRAPENNTATLTAGSTSATFTAFGRDLRGASIRSGDIYNQVAGASASPGTAVSWPWAGSSGAQTITAYGDAVLIGDTSFTVLGDVQLEGYGPLKPMPDRSSYVSQRDSASMFDYTGTSLTHPRHTGIPEGWWVETAFLASGNPQLYLRVAPLPQFEYSISFDLVYKPRLIVPADIESETAIILPIPGDFWDAILVPYVLQRWTGTPWFRNAQAKEEIARQFKVAERMLLDWGGQVEQGGQFIASSY
jgi:hypothetical protein